MRGGSGRITIGVTGHRFLAELDKLQTGIDQVFSRIDLTHPEQPWSVVSSLAEGADCLVVDRILAYPPATRLVVPLPLPVEEYLVGFSSDSSRKEFIRLLAFAGEVIQIPMMSSRDEAYWAAGKYMLELADVLIALWDGQAAQGKGGTGEIVALARAQDLPLAWVQCGNRQPGTSQPTLLGDRQGKVLFERF